MATRTPEWDTSCYEIGEPQTLEAYISSGNTRFYVCPLVKQGWCTHFHWTKECMKMEGKGQSAPIIENSPSAYP